MSTLVRQALQGSPVTVLCGALTASAVVGSTDPLVAVVVFRSWAEGLGPARTFLGAGTAVPALVAWSCSSALVIALGSLVALAAERAAPSVEDDDETSALRRADRAANRLTGSMVAVAGVWLLFGGGGVGLGFLLGALALVAGACLVARPEEGRSGYRIVAGSVRLDDGAAGPAADPFFRTWSEGVKARMRAEPEPEPPPVDERRGPSSRAGSAGPPVVDGVVDPWAVLGLDPDTSLEQVTRRWKRLCKRYHPDVVPRGLQADTLEAVKKINAAYRVIRETLRRKNEG